MELKLDSILESVISNNGHDLWCRLLQFVAWCLRAPTVGVRCCSFAACVKQQLREKALPLAPSQPGRPAKTSQNTRKDTMTSLDARDSSKLEEGDFQGSSQVVILKGNNC